MAIILHEKKIPPMQVESPSQKTDASVDTLYSLVVSVKSSGDIHEVYIDAHFHYTALKVK